MLKIKVFLTSPRNITQVPVYLKNSLLKLLDIFKGAMYESFSDGGIDSITKSLPKVNLKAIYDVGKLDRTTPRGFYMKRKEFTSEQNKILHAELGFLQGIVDIASCDGCSIVGVIEKIK